MLVTRICHGASLCSVAPSFQQPSELGPIIVSRFTGEETTAQRSERTFLRSTQLLSVRIRIQIVAGFGG